MGTSEKSGKGKKQKPANSTSVDWGFVERILASAAVRTLYLYGTWGIGKTYCAYEKGRIDAGVYACTLTEDTPAAELRGHYVPVGGTMEWRDGPFTRAMREGARLVVNELSHGNAEVYAFLYPVLESFETAQLTLPTNETVRPAPGFHVICTDNVAPVDLPPALQDRFDCTLEISEPHPEALAKMTPAVRRAAERTFTLEEDRRVSLRPWLALERLREDFDLADACIAVFGLDRGSQIHDAILLAEAEG